MDWLKDLVGKKKETKATPVKRASVTRKTSGEKRYHVRNSDAKILTAYPNPNGPGFVYRTRTEKGDIRNVHINGNLYKTKEDAEKKVQRIKKEKH
jgi:hypothetical protein